MRSRSFAAWLAVVAGSGCGGSTATGPSSPAPAPLDLGPRLEQVLPEAMPTDPACLGMLADGTGVLVASPGAEPGADGEVARDVRFEFVMLPPDLLVPSPAQPMPAMTFDVGDDAAWSAWRTEVDGGLVARGMVACLAVAFEDTGAPMSSTAVPTGGTVAQVRVSWDDGEIDTDAMTSAEDPDDVSADRVGTLYVQLTSQRTLSEAYSKANALKRAYLDAKDQDTILAVYAHAQGPLLVVAIDHRSAGVSEMRYEPFQTTFL